MIVEPSTKEARLKILIAPNAFKGCLSALRVARLMAVGVRRFFPRARIRLFPLADGGDGTLNVFQSMPRVQLKRTRVRGPRGELRWVKWVFHPRRKWAGIEMALASGLTLVPLKKRNPLRTTSYGVGQLVQQALRIGAKEVWIGLGGSATVDGGVGLLQALGLRVGVKTKIGYRWLKRPAVGGDLPRIDRLEMEGLEKTLRGVRLTLLTDVRHALLGPQGAARVFGPQKGATPAQVNQLEKGLNRWRRQLRVTTGRDAAVVVGGGAAGGIGAGLWAAARARLRPGAAWVLAHGGIDSALRWADVVITGEGHVDRTSFSGKAVGALVHRARRFQRPVWVVAGGSSVAVSHGTRIHVMAPELTTEESQRRVRKLLPSAVAKMFQQGGP